MDFISSTSGSNVIQEILWWRIENALLLSSTLNINIVHDALPFFLFFFLDLQEKVQTHTCTKKWQISTLQIGRNIKLTKKILFSVATSFPFVRCIQRLKIHIIVILCVTKSNSMEFLSAHLKWVWVLSYKRHSFKFDCMLILNHKNNPCQSKWMDRRVHL